MRRGYWHQLALVMALLVHFPRTSSLSQVHAALRMTLACPNFSLAETYQQVFVKEKRVLVYACTQTHSASSIPASRSSSSGSESPSHLHAKHGMAPKCNTFLSLRLRGYLKLLLYYSAPFVLLLLLRFNVYNMPNS